MVALFEIEGNASPVCAQQIYLVYFGKLVAASLEPDGHINSKGPETLGKDAQLKSTS